MDSCRLQTTCLVDGAGDDIGGEHVCAVGVWVAEEVCQADGGEGVGIVVGFGVGFNHYDDVEFIGSKGS